MTPHCIGYIAAVVDRRSRPNWSPIYFVWKSRLLFTEKDAQSVLNQWEQTMAGLFKGCTREVLPIYIDLAHGVAPSQAPSDETPQLLDKLSDDLWSALSFIDSTVCREEVEKIAMRLDEDRRRIAGVDGRQHE